MRQYQIFTRPDNETGSPLLPLPVYLRSTGYKCLEKGDRENTTELHSPFFEMIWCARGIGEAVLFQESFQLYPDDIFFYHPNERHTLHSLSDEWESYWVAFDGPGAAAFFDGYAYPRKLHSTEPCPVELFEEIQNKIGAPSPIVFRSMPALLCRLLALAGGSGKTDDEPVRSALNLIRDNLTNPELNVNYLADQLQIHRSTLVELFQTHLDRTPGQTIRDRRRLTAETLLRGTHLPVKEIAKRCGIPDESSFCRFFQRLCGMTPTQFRHRNKS